VKTHRIAVAVLAVLLVPGCAHGGARPPVQTAPQKVTYLTGFNVTGQDAFMYLATDKGYFREAGLEVAIQPGAGTGSNLKLLAAGKAQFAVVDMTGALIEYTGGAHDFTVVSAIYQRSVSCIMALAISGITHPKDLEGKRIGYQPGGVNYTLFPVYARLSGVDAAKVQWIQTPPQQLRALLAAGRLDAITEVVVGQPGVQAATGRPVSVLPYSDYLTDLYGNVLATSTGTAKNDPGLVTRFRDAMLKGLRYAIDHPDEAGQTLAHHQPTYKAEAATAEVRLTDPYVRAGTIGAIEDRRVMQSIALLQAASAIPSGLTPEQVVTFDLTPKS
jgi:NitT/TauT family transport system substrate-binding protein